MTDSKNIDEGGFAFPTPTLFSPNGTFLSGGSDGMSLRDWFAGQALAGVLSSRESQLQLGRDAVSDGKDSTVYIAEAVYEMADAMIAARKAGG